MSTYRSCHFVLFWWSNNGLLTSSYGSCLMLIIFMFTELCFSSVNTHTRPLTCNFEICSIYLFSLSTTSSIDILDIVSPSLLPGSSLLPITHLLDFSINSVELVPDPGLSDKSLLSPWLPPILYLLSWKELILSHVHYQGHLLHLIMFQGCLILFLVLSQGPIVKRWTSPRPSPMEMRSIKLCEWPVISFLCKIFGKWQKNTE